MFKFRHLAAVLLTASSFFAQANAATVSFSTIVVDYAPTDADTAFLGETGTGSLTFDDGLVSDVGASILIADSLDFEITTFNQTFTMIDTADQLAPRAFFMDGELFAFSFTIAEEIYPLPPQIDEPGILAIGSTPFPIRSTANGDLILDLWVNGPVPEVTGVGPSGIPLPGGILLIGGALAALGGLRLRKSAN